MWRKLDTIWAISLFLIGIAAILLAGFNLMGIVLPDTATRIAGIIILIALPLLAYTTIKKISKQK